MEYNFKPNSYRSKEEEDEKKEKKIEKADIQPVTVKKKSEFKKFGEMLINEDFKTVRKYVFEEVLIPSIKRLISDVVKNGTDMWIGEKRSSSSSTPASKVSYRQYYDDRRPSTSTVKTSYSYDDILFNSRADAEEVLFQMNEIINSEYKVASIADFYELAGVTGKPTDNDYGWTDLRGSTVEKTRDGWIIRFPKAQAL